MADSSKPDGDASTPLENLARAAYESGGGEETKAEDRDSLVEAVLAAAADRSLIRIPDLPGEAPVSHLDAAEGERFPRYEVDGRIGRGGMGLVLKGRDRDLGREVAIKVLDRRHASNSALVQRFIEEAQIGGQLQHPGIVPVHEMGHHPDRRPYFTMKLVKGRTLADLLKERKTPEEDRRRFFDIFEKVCQTMAYAHARSVVHRDLKPANIMVGAFGEVQVMDWGLAKVLGRGETGEEKQPAAAEAVQTVIETVRSGTTDTRSHAGSIMGTPAYMPPEQARGDVEAIDERSDVFALGAILSEILTGKPPYTGKTLSEVRQKAQAGNLTEALDRLEASGLDRDLDRIVRSCLSQELRERPRNAGMVVEAFTAYLASVEERVRTAEVAAARAETRAAGERKVRNRTVLAAVSLVLAAVLISGGLLWSERNRRKRQQQVEGKIIVALDEAKEARRLAGTGDENSLLKWGEAQAAMMRAKAFVEDEEVDPDLRRRVEAFHARVVEESEAAGQAAERAGRDRRMVDRIEEIQTTRVRISRNRFDRKNLISEYAAAFRDFGIDMESMSVESAAARIHESGITDQLVAALDHWGWVAFRVSGGWNDTTRRLIQLAKAVDKNPVRMKLRDAGYDKDLKTLQEMARSPEVQGMSADFQSTLASALLGLDDVEGAVAIMRAASFQYPGAVWIHYNLSVSLGMLDPPGHEEALQHAMAAVALLPGNAAVWNNLGISLVKNGHLDMAIAAQKKALEINPEYTRSLLNLGYCQSRKGNLDAALAAHKRAVTIHPEHADAHLSLAATLEKMGKVKDALEACRTSMRIRPGNPRALIEYGILLAMANDEDGARKAFRDAIRIDPRNMRAYLNLSDLLSTMNQPRSALDVIREAIGIDADDSELHVTRSKILRRLGRIEEAITAARESVRLAPRRAETHYGLGRALAAAGNFPEALSALDTAILFDPVNFKHHFDRGTVLARMRDWDRAIAAFREADRLNPEFLESMFRIGQVLESQGRFREALRYYRMGRGPEALVDVCERRMEIAGNLDAILRGEKEPSGPREHLEISAVFSLMGRHSIATRFWKSFFDAEPTKARSRYLFKAATSAAIAGCGKGKDAGSLDEDARGRLRCQAVAWIRKYLDIMDRVMEEDGGRDLKNLRWSLLMVKKSEDFSRLLEPGLLSKLSEKDQIECIACFARVDKLLERCDQ